MSLVAWIFSSSSFGRLAALAYLGFGAHLLSSGVLSANPLACTHYKDRRRSSTAWRKFVLGLNELRGIRLVLKLDRFAEMINA